MKLSNMILSEPYRIFFPLGWVMGMVGVLHWILVATKVSSDYAATYHGMIEIELFCFAFAVGFLLTALPKFLRSHAVTKLELLSILAAYLFLAGSALGNSQVASQWCFVVLLALLIRFAVIRLKNREAMLPHSFLLVGFGILEGLLGALLINYPIDSLPLIGTKFLEQGMFLSLSLGVGSFLGPRLMGIVDVTNAVVNIPSRAKKEVRAPSGPIVVVAMIGGAIFLSFIIEAGFSHQFGLALRAAAIIYCLVHFGLFNIPKTKSIVGLFVVGALWSIPLGQLAALCFPVHEIGLLHITFIAGFGLLILTVGAQVISSHGGVKEFWQLNRGATIFIVGLVCLASILRVSATLLPSYFFLLIVLAACCFAMAMLYWGVLVVRHIGI